ncbi:MAG: TIR domain-containing protein [Acidobacteria bacterium]|nr:TIR domain-containing protein [Acidobacteriota bacterium]
MRKVFYSFHFDNDVMRVQLIRNIGALEQNEPVSKNRWEEVRQGGKAAIEEWIDQNMRNRSCVVVLVGAETANRPWVRYEIKKAWNENRGLVGVHIHNVNCPRNGRCGKGQNPFENFNVSGTPLSEIVRCYNPSASDAYNSIRENLEDWVEEAVEIRKGFG